MFKEREKKIKRIDLEKKKDRKYYLCICLEVQMKKMEVQ